MQKNTLFNLIASATVAVSGLISIPAHAQNNQSDVTGNNVFNNPVPQTNQSDVAGNTINQATVAQAEQLSQRLSGAYRSCNADGDCEEFNSLLEQSNTFLNNLNEQVANKDSQNSRAW